MSRGRVDPVVVPARLTVAELADRIDVSVGKVRAALAEMGEPSGATDVVGGNTLTRVADRLEKNVYVEPRDMALETLYELEVNKRAAPSGLPPRVAALVDGVMARREELDREIESASEHWSVARMPMLDRSILRLGLYELDEDQSTPTAVILSEAVRLATTYSTERSGAFVNGVLASLARRVRP